MIKFVIRKGKTVKDLAIIKEYFVVLDKYCRLSDKSKSTKEAEAIRNKLETERERVTDGWTIVKKRPYFILKG